MIPPGLLQSEHQSYLPPQAENSSAGEVAGVLLSPLNHIPSPVSPLLYWSIICSYLELNKILSTSPLGFHFSYFTLKNSSLT